ncbi:MAG: exodeoxyribonuclease V subunit gamma [Pseudomonadota bacterium]|nr:exodeoxyribonuclease V subunit gamma [Pseudomonadota bacterium]
MFNLYYGNDTGKLADRLGERLTRQAQDNPLTPVLVLVPQAGLRRWLQVHLAERLGIVANLDFRAPAQFAWDLLRAARPELTERSPFEPDLLRWHLYALLGEPLDDHALQPLQDYLQSDDDPMRRYALAGVLARVFERLQGYRRERLLRWEHARLNRGADAQDWQADLWRRLVRRLGGDYRAARLDAWLRDYAGDNAPPGLPARISAFACANVSPDVLRVLGVCARHAEVDFYWPTPCREYWGDVPRSRRLFHKQASEGVEDNPLLASLGGAGAAFAELLFSYDDVQPDLEEDLSEPPSRGTLLGELRADILERASPRAHSRATQLDGSLQFYACHSPLREVQTLHDRLLAMFARDPTLTPRDIAVMMPDVAAYRPCIEAVFGGLPDHDRRYIPYGVGDIDAAAAHPAAQLFLTLLDAPTSRWTLSELLDVLAVPGVMRRFDLDADGLAQLSGMVRDAGVRWGEDERARAGVGDYREFSFAFGLDRMLAGFAMGDGQALLAGIAPLPGIEGAAFARLEPLLALLAIWRRLRELSPRSLIAAQWQSRLNALVDAIYAPNGADPAETRALERVRAALAQLVVDTRAAQVSQSLPWHDVRAFLRERLAQSDPRQRLFAGGVTFCGMVPLRVVPFRVICLLGLDEAAFPRRENAALDPLLVDRRLNKSERGDRDVRADDRLLFLQLIAAARDTLYISWVGRDPHSNEPRPPSTVVSELMDDLARNYLPNPNRLDSREPHEHSSTPATDVLREEAESKFPLVQPLHPFDARLFDPARSDSQSFRREWLAAAQPIGALAEAAPFARGDLHLRNATDAADPADARDIRLEDLRRFFRNPAREFLETALDMRLPRQLEDDPDLEPLAPKDGLTRWRLTTALLAHDGDASDALATLRAHGELPPGALGEQASHAAANRAAALRERVLAFTAGAAPASETPLTIELDDGTRLVGSLAGRYAAGLLRVRAGIVDGRHVLEAWLDALFAISGGNSVPTVLAALTDKDDGLAFELPQPSPREARETLQELVALYRAGLRAPLPFFPRLSWKHARQGAKQAQKTSNLRDGQAFDLSVFIKAAEQSDNDYNDVDEFSDPAAAIVWRGRDLSGRGDAVLAQYLHLAASTVFDDPARAWVEQFK